MKLLSRILNGSPAHPPLTPQRGQEMAPAATIPPRPETPPAPPPVASGVRLVHWLETATKFGTPIGTIACDALVSEDTVVTVRPEDVTCDACKATGLRVLEVPDPEPVVATCTALTTKGARCLLTPQPGSDRCAMPAHSHERQP